MNENINHVKDVETVALKTEMKMSSKQLSREAEIREFIYKEEIQNTKCGIGSLHPKWLQIFACKEVLILVYSLSGIAQGMLFTYTVAVISTIEKRFKLTSIQTGIILTGNDISAVIFAPFLGYYLNYRHRPRWIGLGIILTAVSSFVAAVPHFIYGPGDDIERGLTHGEVASNLTGINSNSKKEDLCFSTLEESCQVSSGFIEVEESYLGAVVMLFFSQFIVGISMSIFYSIGLSYIDDNVSKKTMSLYYSVTLLLKILGPVFGFLVGGKCLEYWIVPSQSTNLTPKDPRWLGAWWMGFLLIGSGLVVLGISISLFPFKLPETLERKRKKLLKLVEKDEEEAGRNLSPEYLVSLTEDWKRKETKPTLRNMVKVTKKLFSNKIWAANIFNSTVFVLAVSGYNIFKPKYLENQFRKSASEANYYIGMASLIATSLGTLVSALMLRLVRPSPRLVTGYNIFVTLFGCVTYLMMMLIGCPQLEAIGPPPNGFDSGLQCSSECGCSAKFSPVCSEDNITLYYSPCYAGCTTAIPSTNPTVYSGCMCTANASGSPSPIQLSMISATQSASQMLYGTATRGYCPEPCNTFIYYIALEVVTITIYASGKIGSTIIHLRAVADEDKGISIGILEVFLALFGFIPAPLIMGRIIDSSCVVWEESCGVKGNCWLYDMDKFRILLHVVAAGLVLLSVLGDVMMFKYADCLDLYGEREPTLPLPPTHEDTETKTKDESQPINPSK